MMTVRLLGLAILVTTFAGCNCGGTIDGPDTGDPNKPIEEGDGGTRRDGGGGSSGIVVTCEPVPAAVPVNTQVRITCNIDSGGKSLSMPELTASPSGGVELANGSQMGQVLFSLSTGKPGYVHPTNFADTVFTLNVRVRNAAKASEYGEGTVTVTVLGNYWIGDGSTGDGVGIFVHLSDGAYLRNVVGPVGFKAVSDLRMLPSGDIVASSMSNKQIKVFNRQGVEQAPAAFETTDRWAGNAPIWDDSGTFGSVGPRQMAVSSLGELWVTGARENKVWGIAVFNPGTGALLKFVPTPETNNAWAFTSIARRTDGKMAVSSSERRSICLFDEKTYATSGCVLVENNGFANYSTLLGLPDARLLCGINGDSTNGDPLYLLNPTLGVEQVGEGKSYYPEMTALAVHGAEYLALGAYGSTVGNILVRRFDVTTLKEITPPWDVGPQGHYMPVGAGLVRLTTPGL